VIPASSAALSAVCSASVAHFHVLGGSMLDVTLKQRRSIRRVSNGNTPLGRRAGAATVIVLHSGTLMPPTHPHTTTRGQWKDGVDEHQQLALSQNAHARVYICTCEEMEHERVLSGGEVSHSDDTDRATTHSPPCIGQHHTLSFKKHIKSNTEATTHRLVKKRIKRSVNCRCKVVGKRHRVLARSQRCG
jgi:hypothetical protein